MTFFDFQNLKRFIWQKILDLPFCMILHKVLLVISGSSSKQFLFISFGYDLERLGAVLIHMILIYSLRNDPSVCLVTVSLSHYNISYLILPGRLLPSFKDNLFRVLGSGGSPPPIQEWHIPNPPPSDELKYRMHCTLYSDSS